MSSTSSRLPYQPRCRWDGPAASPADIYQQLPIENFRVLCLNGYTDQGVLRCSLHRTSFAAALAYTAISYTWNEADKIWYGEYNQSKKPIWIDSKLVQIADKVANILCLALLHGRRVLWIDTICINQSNPDEKNHQVARMGNIYAGATDVLCFLSNPTSKTDAIMHSIKLGSSVHGERLWVENQKGVQSLIEDHYWTRAWTLQETVLAKTAQICCGSKMIKHSELVEFKKRIGAAHIRRRDILRGLGDLWHVPNALRHGKDANESFASKQVPADATFLEVLRACRGSRECTDPRDLIYSRLALSTDASVLVPYPDYSLDVEELYRRFATNCILLTKSLEIITFATETARRLPSWIPDWTTRNYEWKIDATYTHITEPLAKISWQVKDLPRISRCRTELMVQGRVLSTVRSREFIDRLVSSLAQMTIFRDGYTSSEIPDTGDLVCILKDCSTPVYLRQVDDHYAIVGRTSSARMSFENPYVSPVEGAYEALKKANDIPESIFRIR